MIEYVIDIDNELKLPKRAWSAFTGDFLEDLTQKAIINIVTDQDFNTTQKAVTEVFDDYQATYKDRMKRRLSKDSGVKWEFIKDETAYPAPNAPSINSQVNKTWLVSKREFRNTIANSQRRYRQASEHLRNANYGYLKQMGLEGATDREIASSIVDQITNKLGEQLGINMTNREEALRQTTETRTKYLKAKEELQLTTVQYKLGDRERHCPECVALAGSIYNDINNAPGLPRHTRCGCFYEEYKIR